MLRLLIGLFLALHGLVYVLYAGQSARRFELQPGMTWPDESWLFSKRLSREATRKLASMGCILAALGFVASGIGIALNHAWGPPLVAGTSAYASVLILLCWDGTVRAGAEQGGIGLLINLAILLGVSVL